MVNVPDDYSRMSLYWLDSKEAENKAKEYRALSREAEAIETAGDTSLIIREKMRELVHEIFLLERNHRRDKRQREYNERPDVSGIPSDVDAYLVTSPYEGEQVINLHFPSGTSTTVMSITLWQAREIIQLLEEKLTEAETYNEEWFVRNVRCLVKMAGSVVSMNDDTVIGKDLKRHYARLHGIVDEAFKHIYAGVSAEEYEHMYALLEEFYNLPEP